MTTDQHANDALRALVREPVELSEEGLRAVLTAIPDTPQQRSWPPLSTQWRLQSMFSATKFFVAGAIVALFGGFLMSGVRMQQPSDVPLPPAAASASSSPEADALEQSVRTDLLPGVDLVTEEVEPGVLRVEGDGMRELGWTLESVPFGGLGPRVWTGLGIGAVGITTPLDGSVWVRLPSSGEGYTTLRLGSPGESTDILRIGPDGTEHVEMPTPGDPFNVPDAVLFIADGSTWVEDLTEGRRRLLARRDAGTDAWTLIDHPEAGSRGGRADLKLDAWAATADGTVYVVRYGTLYRFEDDGWTVLGDPGRRLDALFLGWDGTLWVRGRGRFARLDGDRWITIDLRVDSHGPGSPVVAGVDGHLWLGSYQRIPSEMLGDERATCDGLIGHDAATTVRFLDSLCIHDVSVAVDGSVWVLAGPAPEVVRYHEMIGPVELYVITPEAVAQATAE